MTACPSCNRERSQGQCWFLTCPSNGASGQALAMMRTFAGNVMADCERAAQRMRRGADLFHVDNPDNAPSKATAHMIEDEDDED